MTSLAKGRAYGEAPRSGATPSGLEVLAALRRAPAGMAVPPAVAHYVGIPFAPKGDRFEGADCRGLQCLVYERERGIHLPRHHEAYDAKWLGERPTREDARRLADTVARLLEPDWRQIAFDEAELYDSLLLPIAGEPCHIAMYVGDLHILHVEREIAAVCEDLRTPRWQSRIRRARLFRHAGAARC
jgi:cell wall-associated NlpC family hydrolase